MPLLLGRDLRSLPQCGKRNVVHETPLVADHNAVGRTEASVPLLQVGVGVPVVAL